MLQTDTGSNSALGGTAELQAGGPFSTSSITTKYDLLLDHAATSGNGSFEKAARFDLTTAGTVVGGTEDDDLNDVRVNVTGGTYTVDTRGRVLISATTQPPSGPASTSTEVAYIVTPFSSTPGAPAARMYAMSTDVAHGEPGVGNADQVGGTPIFNPPGAYNFTLNELGEPTKSGNKAEIGQFTVTGTTNLNGIVIVNASGTVSANAVTATLPANTARIEIAKTNIPAPGFATGNGLIMYITSTSGGIMLGETPDLDGRFLHQ